MVAVYTVREVGVWLPTLGPVPLGQLFVHLLRLVTEQLLIE